MIILINYFTVYLYDIFKDNIYILIVSFTGPKYTFI